MGRTGFNKFIGDYDTLHPFLRLISYSYYDLLSVSGRQLIGRWERLHRAWMQTQQRKDDCRFVNHMLHKREKEKGPHEEISSREGA